MTASQGLRPRLPMPTSTSDLVTSLRARARALGFDACRIAAPQAAAEARARLAPWLATGAQGDMGWMAESAARRADPQTLWPDVRSIILLAMSYAPPGDALADLETRGAGNISVYARHRDYHDVVKGRLKMLGQWLAGAAGGEIKVFVDTAPVMEKPLAAAAGLGWQGKHGNLVARGLGSWLFLGAVFTTLELAPDAPESDHCGSCRACLDACPTDAFPAPYRVDARRCISYLTIEHKGVVAREFREKIGNRIYGCDDCLAVCPWNKFAQAGREAKLSARADLVSPSLAELAGLDDAGFRAMFAGSPVKRIGRARFLRNVLIAIGNARDLALLPVVVDKLRDASPLVRGMAVWALSRLDPAMARQMAADDADADVRAEWAMARETVG